MPENHTDFRPGDLVATTMTLRYAGELREPLPAGAQAIVTKVYTNGLLAINPVDHDERTDRVVRAAACTLIERPRDIRLDWNLIAEFMRGGDALELLYQWDVLPPRQEL